MYRMCSVVCIHVNIVLVTHIVVSACDYFKRLLSVIDEHFEALEVALGSCQVSRCVTNFVFSVGINLVLYHKL